MTLFSDEYLAAFRDVVSTLDLGPQPRGAFDAAPASLRRQQSRLVSAMRRKFGAGGAADALRALGLDPGLLAHDADPQTPAELWSQKNRDRIAVLRQQLEAKVQDPEAARLLDELMGLIRIETAPPDGEDDVPGGPKPTELGEGDPSRAHGFSGHPTEGAWRNPGADQGGPDFRGTPVSRALERAHDERMARDEALRREAAAGPSESYLRRFKNAARIQIA